MEIIIKEDPITGHSIYEYKEEPKKLTPEDKAKEDKWFNDILESNRIHNQFMNRLVISFWTLKQDHFQHTWNIVLKEYTHYSLSENKIKTIEEIQHDFKSSFVNTFVESMYQENHQQFFKENINLLHQMWGSQLNADLFILLTWQMNFKEQSLSLLEKFPCNFNSDVYEHIQSTFIKDFRQSSLPLNITEKNQILEEDKNHFLKIQNIYTNFKKLDQDLIPKNTKSKLGKI